MNLTKLSEPLNITDIDFRVQSINRGGYATILAYKDARVDMNRLDQVCGHLNWKREHSRDNQNCTVSIWDASKNQWVSKEDTGTESNTEKEKGLASDSFKRACFNWGIGRELYDYPIIQIKLNADEFDPTTFKATYNLKVKEWVWSSEFKDGKIVKLSCIDNKGVKRFDYNATSVKTDAQTFDNEANKLAELKTLGKFKGKTEAEVMAVYKKLGYQATKEKLNGLEQAVKMVANAFDAVIDNQKQ